MAGMQGMQGMKQIVGEEAEEEEEETTIQGMKQQKHREFREFIPCIASSSAAVFSAASSTIRSSPESPASLPLLLLLPLLLFLLLPLSVHPLNPLHPCYSFFFFLFCCCFSYLLHPLHPLHPCYSFFFFLFCSCFSYLLHPLNPLHPCHCCFFCCFFFSCTLWTDVGRKRIAILGATGSVGRQALEIIAGSDRLGVCALAAGANWELLAEQAKRFRPQAVAVADEGAARSLSAALGGGVEVLAGADAAAELVHKVRPDLVLTAMVGTAGLAPTLAAIECGADLAVANKESLVMAGAVIMPAARAAGIAVLPVDSEHSAIFLAMQSGRPAEVRRVWLTASGGPFRSLPLDELDRVTPEQALQHPNWAMGPKVTIDSATMMNKALEVIEAKWLFRLGVSQIRVLIHPQSIVHSLVEFCDGSTIAQLGVPDMRVPIQYALTYPERRPGPVAAANLAQVGRLDFAEPDLERFPALGLGYRAAEAGGTLGAVLNAANEAAVRAFLDGRLAFPAIARLVAGVMDRHHVVHPVTAEAIGDADRWARQEAESWIASS